jgi:hypothetical protein
MSAREPQLYCRRRWASPGCRREHHTRHASIFKIVRDHHACDHRRHSLRRRTAADRADAKRGHGLQPVLHQRARQRRQLREGPSWASYKLRDAAIVRLICPTCQKVFARSLKASIALLLCMGLFSIFRLRAGSAACRAVAGGYDVKADDGAAMPAASPGKLP